MSLSIGRKEKIYSRLSRCSTVRESGSELSLGGLTLRLRLVSLFYSLKVMPANIVENKLNYQLLAVVLLGD